MNIFKCYRNKIFIVIVLVLLTCMIVNLLVVYEVAWFQIDVPQPLFHVGNISDDHVTMQPIHITNDTGWKINWNVLISTLIDEQLAKIQVSQSWFDVLFAKLIEIESESESQKAQSGSGSKSQWKLQSKLQANPQASPTISQLSGSNLNSLIGWNNPYYIGYCRPFLYPYVAFVTSKDMSLFFQSTNLKSELQSESQSHSQLELQLNPFEQIEQFWDQINVDIMTTVDKKDSNISDGNNINIDEMIDIFGDKFELYNYVFNTSITYDNMIRAQYFENHKSVWRYGSLVVIADSLNKNKIDNIEYIKSKTMIIEIVISSNHHMTHLQRNKTSINVSNMSNRFLCVFSDGSTIISEPRIEGFFHYFVIQCNITNNNQLKHKIYKQTLSKLKMEKKSNSQFMSNIGLTLFSLHPKFGIKDLLNEYAISMNVQLPVCGITQINRKPRLYQSEKDYHLLHMENIENIENTEKTAAVHSSIKFTSKPEMEELGTGYVRQADYLKDDLSFSNFVSIANTIHPRSRSGQMGILIQQWIDYNLFQGFEHFYFYDHLYNRDINDISYFYDVLKDGKYISNGYVTIIEWPIIARKGEPTYYQFTAFLDCMRRFIYDTKYLWFGDIDEFVIPKPNHQRIKMDDENTLNMRTQQNKNKNKHRHNEKGQSTIYYFDFYFSNVLYPLINESEMLTARQIINYTLEMQSASKIPTMLEYKQHNYNGLALMNYPGLPSIYNYWQNLESSKGNDNNINNGNNGNNDNTKQLGCDAKNKNNRYDTYLERQSCLHYITHTKDELKNRNFNLTQMSNVYPNGDKLYKYLSDLHLQSNYEVRAKLIINPRIVFVGIHHNTHSSRSQEFDRQVWIKEHSELNPKQNKNGFIQSGLKWQQYDMFMLHIRDHWNHLEKMSKMINFSNSNDIKLFYSITNDQCHFENLILYWNNKFLKSSFGKKWKKMLTIEPLVDTDGIFCYLKDKNFTLQWTNSIKHQKL